MKNVEGSEGGHLQEHPQDDQLHNCRLQYCVRVGRWSQLRADTEQSDSLSLEVWRGHQAFIVILD